MNFVAGTLAIGHGERASMGFASRITHIGSYSRFFLYFADKSLITLVNGRTLTPPEDATQAAGQGRRPTDLDIGEAILRGPEAKR